MERGREGGERDEGAEGEKRCGKRLRKEIWGSKGGQKRWGKSNTFTSNREGSERD